jgi:hypothetical protein
LIVERREFQRYIPHENAFAAVGRDYSRVGKIKNIALGGLAFEYIVGLSPKEEATQADIFLVGNVFHLHNIPCRIIYDVEVHVPHVNNNYIKILTTKRCGLQFKSNSDEIITQLMIFIEAYSDRIA